MIRLLYILGLLIAPFIAFAPIVEAARLDFTKGQPAVINNNTCPTRYNFSGGQPTLVYDATQNCTGGATPTQDDGQWFMLFQ